MGLPDAYAHHTSNTSRQALRSLARRTVHSFFVGTPDRGIQPRNPAQRGAISNKPGRMVNDLRQLATAVDDLPNVEVSADPYDNFLLAMAQVAQTNLLVTGLDCTRHH